jgi:hypothetical protein
MKMAFGDASRLFPAAKSVAAIDAHVAVLCKHTSIGNERIW